jgi:outer membrane protein OmpA-like peptidoglycan-associated protein
MRPIQTLFLLSGVLLGLAAGCAQSNSRLTTCQAEKEQLLATIRDQRDTNHTLNNKLASLESRLDQAEKELAKGGSGTRLSSRPPAITSGPPTSAAAKAPLRAPTESLPWRSPPGNAPASTAPAGKAESNAPPVDNRRSSRTSDSAASLAKLVRRDPRFRYDAKIGAAQINVPVAFSGQTATLTAEDKRQLDDIARLLKSDEARDLKIMVSDGTGANAARAQAVADYFDRHGIAGERLAVANAPAARSSQSASGVQVFLLDPAASIAGWNATPQSTRR